MPANLGGVRIEWDEAALDDLLNSLDGPVGRFIWDLSVKAATIAEAEVHVRPGTPSSATTGRTSNAYPPGYTKKRIRPHLARGAMTGRLYGGVNAPYTPSTWLETPASQIAEKGHKFPFLTTGVYSLEGTF
jgi:hypothetical protein